MPKMSFLQSATFYVPFFFIYIVPLRILQRLCCIRGKSEALSPAYHDCFSIRCRQEFVQSLSFVIYHSTSDISTSLQVFHTDPHFGKHEAIPCIFFQSDVKGEGPILSLITLILAKVRTRILLYISLT